MFNLMVDQRASLDRTFSALADPTRREILARLRRGPVNVGDLAEPFDMTLAAVSKHLGVLERAGLIHRESHGRERRCHLRARPLRAASAWTEAYRSFWEERFDALEAHLRTRRRRSKRR